MFCMRTGGEGAKNKSEARYVGKRPLAQRIRPHYLLALNIVSLGTGSDNQDEEVDDTAINCKAVFERESRDSLGRA